jgi:hypothetical protein
MQALEPRGGHHGTRMVGIQNRRNAVVVGGSSDRLDSLPVVAAGTGVDGSEQGTRSGRAVTSGGVGWDSGTASETGVYAPPSERDEVVRIEGLRVPVNLTGLVNQQIFDRAAIWAIRTGNAVRLVSANDHGHARYSAHYADKALDLHSTDNDGLAEWFRQWEYRVLWRVPGHFGHVHVEDLQ